MALYRAAYVRSITKRPIAIACFFVIAWARVARSEGPFLTRSLIRCAFRFRVFAAPKSRRRLWIFAKALDRTKQRPLHFIQIQRSGRFGIVADSRLRN